MPTLIQKLRMFVAPGHGSRSRGLAQRFGACWPWHCSRSQARPRNRRSRHAVNAGSASTRGFGDLVHEARDHYRAKRFGRAVALYTEALAMRPDPKNTHMLYFERGTTQMDGQNHPAAVADFDQAVRLRPTDWEAINMAAWLRATSRNAAARNGRLAVQQATRACELTKWKNPDVLDTLAAAHAEAGISSAPCRFRNRRSASRRWENGSKCTSGFGCSNNGRRTVLNQSMKQIRRRFIRIAAVAAVGAVVVALPEHSFGAETKVVTPQELWALFP
jgi:tetratricopeptide (TPR) repeat protein